MVEMDREVVGRVLTGIPCSNWVLTSHYEDKCAGVLVSFVQQVSFDPPMVMVALNKGCHIIPLIHDSHAFALCQIEEGDRLLTKKFSHQQEDVFETMGFFHGPQGSSIIKRALAWMDCRLERHLDVDGDHDIYVGSIRGADVLKEGKPIIRQREDGFGY